MVNATPPDDLDALAGKGRMRDGPRLVSGRNGPRGRTFHCAVTSISKKEGGLARAVGGLDYDSRRGKHSNRDDELEAEGGRSREAMAAILEAVDAANSRKNGKVALRLHVELPAETTADQRRRIAEGVAAWFEDRDCPAHWAVHTRNSRKDWQPHLHMTVAPRAVVEVHGHWFGMAPGTPGRPGPRPVIDGPAAMQAFRRQVVAGVVNQVTGLDWHGGRLEETGIDRPARKRLPEAAYKRVHLLDRDTGLARANAEIDAGLGDQVVARRRAWVLGEQERRMAAAMAEEAQRDERRRARIKHLGGVPRGDLRALAAAKEPIRVAGVVYLPQANPKPPSPSPTLFPLPPGAFVLETMGPGQAGIWEGEPQPGQPPLIVSRRDFARSKLEQHLGRPLAPGELVEHDREESRRRREAREAILAAREAAAEEQRRRQAAVDAAEEQSRLEAEQRAAWERIEAQRLDKAEIERLARQRVEELLAQQLARPSEAPATWTQIATMVKMLEERGIGLPEGDQPITAGVAGQIIRHLQTIPRQAPPAATQAPSQDPPGQVRRPVRAPGRRSGVEM